MKGKERRTEDETKDLSDKTGYSKLLSKELIDNLLKILVYNIKTGQLNLKNFGSFNKNES